MSQSTLKNKKTETFLWSNISSHSVNLITRGALELYYILNYAERLRKWQYRLFCETFCSIFYYHVRYNKEYPCENWHFTLLSTGKQEDVIPPDGNSFFHSMKASNGFLPT